METTERKQFLACVVNGITDTIFIEKKDLAKFIAKKGIIGNIKVTDLNGFDILTTYGTFLNKILPEVREEIIEELVQYQMSSDVPDFKEYSIEEMKRQGYFRT